MVMLMKAASQNVCVLSIKNNNKKQQQNKKLFCILQLLQVFPPCFTVCKVVQETSAVLNLEGSKCLLLVE